MTNFYHLKTLGKHEKLCLTCCARAGSPWGYRLSRSLCNSSCSRAAKRAPAPGGKWGGREGGKLVGPPLAAAAAATANGSAPVKVANYEN